MKFTGAIGKIDQAIWQLIWDNLTNGERITIRFYANDTLGNAQYKEISLIKQIPIDLPRFFSEPIGFLLPIIGTVVMLPITVKLTKSRYYKTLNSKEKKKLKNVLIATFFFLSLILLFYLM